MSNTIRSNAAVTSKGVVVPPLFDVVLDLGHPGAASTVASTRSWFPTKYAVDDGDVTNGGVRAECSSEAFVSRVVPFCFPAYTGPTTTTTTTTPTSLNRFHIYLSQFVSRPFVFALQLQCGQRVYGHVKPYLPPRSEAKCRIDVGRRGVRAFVVFTRRDGTHHSGDSFVYPNLLDALEQLCIMEDHVATNPQKLQGLLDEFYDKDQQLLKGTNGNNLYTYPTSLRALGAEYKNDFVLHEDVIALAAAYSAPISRTLMPFLRRIGPSHFLRILSAIMCERRIVFVSVDPTRLTNACQACRALLAHGKLAWHHVFVPVVPPHLLPHLAAPFPYICGILNKYMELLKISEMGTFLLVHLDRNELQVYGEATSPDAMFPDLLRPVFVDDRYVQQASTGIGFSGGAGGNSITEPVSPNSSYAALGGVQGQHTHYQPDTPQLNLSSAPSSSTLSECLAQDLFSILKQDQTLWAVTTGASGKAADVVAESFSKGVGGLRNLVKAVKNAKRVSAACTSPDLNNKSYNESNYTNNLSNDMNGDEEETWFSPEEQKRLSDTLDSFWDGEFAFNARAEEELRIALTSFFICLLGDSNTFLSPPNMQLDRSKFMEQRKLRGDYEGTPMYVVLTHFIQSQILEQFALETASNSCKQPMQLFDLTVAHLQKAKLDYSLVTVKQVARSVSQNSPYMKIIHNAQVARERTLVLTSKTGYNSNSSSATDNNNLSTVLPDPVTDLAQLVEACRAIPEVRLTTMAVVWTRIRDSKGMQSKHALLALQVIKNLLLHGPLTCVADVFEYIHVIRLMRIYHSRLARDTSQQIRFQATQIYALLVDKSLLMAQRRFYCANRKRDKMMKQRPVQQPLHKRAKFSNKLKFAQVHEVLRPGAAVANQIKVVDLLDFDGNTNSAVISAAPPVLRTAASASSCGLDELLSFDSATEVSQQPSLVTSMRDLGVASAASNKQVVPEGSCNPFDPFDASSRSFSSTQSPAKIDGIASSMAGTQPIRTVSSSGPVMPVYPLTTQQQQQPHMVPPSPLCTPYGPPPGSQQVHSAYDPYQQQNLQPSQIRPISSDMNGKQVFQHHNHPAITSQQNVVTQPSSSTYQIPAPMPVAQPSQRQQISQYNGFAGQPQQFLPQQQQFSPVQQLHPQQRGYQPQPQPGQQLHGALPPPAFSGLQKASQQSNVMWNQQPLLSAPSNNINGISQRQNILHNQAQQQQAAKPHIQFDPFAAKHSTQNVSYYLCIYVEPSHQENIRKPQRQPN